MKKLSVKIIVTVISVFFLSTFVPRILFGPVIDDIREGHVERDVFLLGMLFSATLALLLFSLAINHLVIRRIKMLNEATKRVAKGDFDVAIPVYGQDEISGLSSNFNTMVDALKSNAYLSATFARQFSHEFKTPVTAINGYAQMIAADPEATEDIKASAGIIASESERLSELSQSALVLSRLESDVIVKTDDQFNVSEQIRTIIRMMQVVWEGRNMTFSIDMEDVRITSNRDLTYHIFNNLISNAIAYGDTGSDIGISLEQTGEAIAFSITNHGKGIPESDRERIFETFGVARTDRKQGTGIGLSIVRKAVTHLKGDVSVTGPEDGPTTFSITLPIAQKDA
jgi:signal transduction histidine kinase